MRQGREDMGFPMQWLLEIDTILQPLVGLSGADRIRAAGRWSTGIFSIQWGWVLVAVVGLAVVCGIAVGVTRYTKKAKEAGVTETEQHRSAPMRGEAGAGNPRADSSAGRAGASRDGPGSMDLGPLAEGGPMSELLGKPADANEIGKILVNPVEIWKGDTLLIRYPKGAVMWEFDAWLGSADEEVVVRPLGAARWVDRRRFERIQVDAKAWVAPLPFERTAGPMDQARSFVEARLTELATIGLRFEAPLDVQVGLRVLVILTLSGQRHVEAMGIVRRCWDPTNGGNDFAVELVCLHSDEVGQLARETEAAKNGEAPRQVPEEAEEEVFGQAPEETPEEAPAEAEPVAQA